jgi:uracil phosphoribosyltransferase
MLDSQYQTLPTPKGGLEHEYGNRVHLLSMPYAMSVLERLCSPETKQPTVNHLVATLYDQLLATVASTVLAKEHVNSPTRMSEFTPKGVYSGECIDRSQRIVVVDVARAGIIPSHRFYEGLHHIVDADALRQDHVVASRLTDPQGRVTGVTLDGSKIGGPIDGATVIFPDPMGATGSSIAGVIEHYLAKVGGTPRALVAAHLIVTPEYLRRMTSAFPDLHIFAIRLDRGLSTPDVLSTRPGTHWSQEVGLTDNQYIVPGAGGVGEVLNNAWI